MERKAPDVRERIRRMEERGTTHKPGFMDIRYFIGLTLSFYGFVIALYGAARPELSAKSLGINVNLWWGLFILAMGAFFYAISRKPREWLGG